MSVSFVARDEIESRITQALNRSRGAVLLGPRQAGKTTIARRIARRSRAEYFDLEDPSDLARLTAPKLTLGRARGLVVLDEIQLRPDLLPLLRVLLDRQPLPAKFLLLGSAAPDLVRGTSETLAGRVELVSMVGFRIGETGAGQRDRLWLRGGFPPSYLAASDEDSFAWRQNFLRTFVERDLRQFGFEMAPYAMRRFLLMVAHLHGQRWNGSAVASSLAVSHTTARRYLDLLAGAYLVRQLHPWFQNIGKRLVKSPKVYFRDSGLLHALLGLEHLRDVESHPCYGASWEGMCVEEIAAVHGERDCWFWATHGGAELDVLALHRGARIGYECKLTDSPRLTKSMHVALNDLGLDHLFVVHPGEQRFPLAERVTAIPLSDIATAATLAGERSP